jgi:hypothetical protein
MEYQYIVIEHGQKYPFDAAAFEGPLTTLRLVAEVAADHYWHNRDGWEATWPLTFELFRDGQSLGRCVVDVEAQPLFGAVKEYSEKGGE